MRIGGFQKVSLIDYPGKVATVVFVAGCNFRCPYCHNRDLVLNSENLPAIPEAEILAYLKKREGLLDGVVITGGEPTLQKDLSDFAKKIKELGFLVKLDTNGSKFSILQSMVKNGLVDYVALDIKGPLDRRYGDSVGISKFAAASILQSMVKVARSGVDYELRTTVVPELHSEADLLDLARQLSEVAPKATWFLQNFQPKNCLNPEFEKIKPYDNIFFERLIGKLRVHMPQVELRG
jgi:pyruvate formate lyase activating enzyme